MIKKYKEFFESERKELISKIYNFFKLDVSDIQEILYGVSDYVDLMPFPYPGFGDRFPELNGTNGYFGFQILTSVGTFFLKIEHNRFYTAYGDDKEAEIRSIVDEILRRYDRLKSSSRKYEREDRKSKFEFQIRFKKSENALIASPEISDEEKEFIEEAGQRISDVLNLQKFKIQTTFYEIFLVYDVLQENI